VLAALARGRSWPGRSARGKGREPRVPRDVRRRAAPHAMLAPPSMCSTCPSMWSLAGEHR
jgi:hypothetical protein